jgi:hypothetical protein
LCTTFATEVALRRNIQSDGTTIKVSIQPASHRTEESKERLRRFSSPFSNIEDFESMVNAAKTLLASERHPGSKENSFLDDVLKIEYMHPNAPQLTLVDLPGKSIITVASWYH